jgi:TfoX/Sxy family transcriptional regulator of competence genes
MRCNPIVPKKQPTQTTSKGYEIPIPKKRDFDQMLERAANPIKKSAARRSKK